MAFTITLLLLFALIFLVSITISHQRSQRPPKGYRRVPGPKGRLPIIGHAHQLSSPPQRQFQAWAREYGELYQIQLGWENWVFLCSPAAVKEILDKQSAVTSSRAPMPVGSDVLSGGMRFLFMGYNPLWRKLRAITHKLLTPAMSETFQPSQEFEAKQLVFDILTDNEGDDKFYQHVRRYTSSVVMTSTYGKRIPSWENEDIHQIYQVMKEFTENTAPGDGAFLADLIPPLAKLPVQLQWWRPRAHRLFLTQSRLWMRLWNNLQHQIATKTAPECFVKQFVCSTDYASQGISEEQAAFVAGSMIEAGSETTSAALNTCIKYLAANPRVQTVAYEELTRVLGGADGNNGHDDNDDEEKNHHHRSPTFADEPNLPYIRAIVKEVLRIRPVTNIGTPHYTTAPVTYRDYYIPANTVVNIYQYAIHFDPSLYPDPYSFRPERYLNHTLKAGASAAHPDPYQRDHFGFGAGRRICSGLHLAEASLFITVAKLLWAFEIRPPLKKRANVDDYGVGAGGKEEEEMDCSDEAFEEGTNTVPRRFRARFLVRSPQREAVIREEWEMARKEGFKLRGVKVEEGGMLVE